MSHYCCLLLKFRITFNNPEMLTPEEIPRNNENNSHEEIRNYSEQLGKIKNFTRIQL